ncbi:MAG: hypothetical protein ACTSUT_07910 [Promethearchaeota archaeon]
MKLRRRKLIRYSKEKRYSKFFVATCVNCNYTFDYNQNLFKQKWDNMFYADNIIVYLYCPKCNNDQFKISFEYRSRKDSIPPKELKIY